MTLREQRDALAAQGIVAAIPASQKMWYEFTKDEIETLRVGLSALSYKGGVGVFGAKVGFKADYLQEISALQDKLNSDAADAAGR